MAQTFRSSRTGRPRRKIIGLTLLVITTVLSVVAFTWWSSLPDDDDIVVPDPAALPLPITTSTLLVVYQSDPTLSALRNRSLRITAPVASKPTSSTNILLKTPDPLLTIGADLIARDATRLVDLEPGSEVTLLCESVEPGVRAPMLEHCSLVAAL